MQKAASLLRELLHAARESQIAKHDPEKLALGRDPRVDTGFRKRSWSNK
jgi:hypothetical protein